MCVRRGPSPVESKPLSAVLKAAFRGFDFNKGLTHTHNTYTSVLRLNTTRHTHTHTHTHRAQDERIADLESRLAASEGVCRDQAAEIAALKEEIEELKRKLDELMGGAGARIKALEEEVARLKAELAAANKELEELRRKCAEQAYQLQATAPLRQKVETLETTRDALLKRLVESERNYAEIRRLLQIEKDKERRLEMLQSELVSREAREEVLTAKLKRLTTVMTEVKESNERANREIANMELKGRDELDD